jgi:hypothetical protein
MGLMLDNVFSRQEHAAEKSEFADAHAALRNLGVRE